MPMPWQSWNIRQNLCCSNHPLPSVLYYIYPYAKATSYGGLLIRPYRTTELLLTCSPLAMIYVPAVCRHRNPFIYNLFLLIYYRNISKTHCITHSATTTKSIFPNPCLCLPKNHYERILMYLSTVGCGLAELFLRQQDWHSAKCKYHSQISIQTSASVIRAQSK